MANKPPIWEDYERECRLAREALTDSGVVVGFRKRAPGRVTKVSVLRESYERAVLALQEYLSRIYGWRKG